MRWLIALYILQTAILKSSSSTLVELACQWQRIGWFQWVEICAGVSLSDYTKTGTNILNISCIGETNEKHADIYWSISYTNPPPYPVKNVRIECVRTIYEGKTIQCDLELEMDQYKGGTFYCHIGSYRQPMYSLPQSDRNNLTWMYIEELSGAYIKYRTSATCVIDVSDKLYPKDFTPQWVMLNNLNSLRFVSTFDPNKRQVRAQLKHTFLSSDDGLRIACICRHYLYGECGRKEAWLKLKQDTTVDIEPAITTTQPENITENPDSSRMWLAFGVSAASLVILSAVSVFIWRYFLMNKVNEDLTEELCNDVMQMYAVPVKKSQRNKKPMPSGEQDLAEYDTPNNDVDEYIYSIPEFENDCNIYDNVPIPTSSNSTDGRTQDFADIEPVYANTVSRYKPNV